VVAMMTWADEVVVDRNHVCPSSLVGLASLPTIVRGRMRHSLQRDN